MLKSILRSTARRLGYEIVGPPRAYAAQLSLIGLLRKQEIDLVLDVGANSGQFAHELRSAGYSGRILSFEPQAAAHAALCASAAEDAKWTVARRVALGAQAGSVMMHTSKNSYSSSLLPMLAAHSEAAPESIYVGEESVEVQPLDELCELTSTDRVLLKIDVQGYEQSVLEGSSRVLAACQAVIVEMSLLPLYEGQMLAKDMWLMLANAGFSPWAFEPVFRDTASGRMLQMDGLFIREHERLTHGRVE